MTILKLEHIDKIYNGNYVLKDFNFELKPHSFTVIAGPSGSGKSTLLNMIGLLEKQDKGTITLFDETNVRPYSRKATMLLRDKIGYLFQNYALIENESVRYNLEVALEEVKTTGNRKDLMKEALLQVGIPEYYITKKVCQCSGGEQQRIAIARLLLKPCELILADEPTGSLDETNKLAVYELLRSLQKQGKTILMVSHDPELIALADEVIYLQKLDTTPMSKAILR